MAASSSGPNGLSTVRYADVEHAGPLGVRGEPGLQAVGGGRVEPEGGCGQVVDDLVRCS